MNKRVLVIASVIGVVFVFAGFNLYSYFKEQQAIQMEEDRLALERQQQRERERLERAAAEKAEQERLAAERQAEEERRAAERVAEEQRREQERLAAEAERQAEMDAADQEKRDRAAQELARNLQRAREVDLIEGMDEAELRTVRGMSPRYLLEHPEVATEVLSIGPNTRHLGGARRFLKDQSTNFMMFAAASKNPALLSAALEAGAEINAANVDGYTALMFAAAYNSPEIVSWLLERGAEISATAGEYDLNALHIAALFNPHPDVVETLIKAGLDIEGKTGLGDTPLVAASLENPNPEVILRLAELGADTTAFASENGLTPYNIVTNRLEGQGPGLRHSSDDFEASVLKALE